MLDLDTTPIANASDYDAGTLFRFTFGAYGETAVYAWGRGVEAALEEAAGWLKEHAPGAFHALDCTAAATEIGAPEAWREDEEWAEKVQACAEEDTTYTESGHLLSWEWHVSDETDDDAVAYIRWRSRENADADDLTYVCDGPDDEPAECAGDIGRTYYPPDWRPYFGYFAETEPDIRAPRLIGPPFPADGDDCNDGAE